MNAHGLKLPPVLLLLLLTGLTACSVSRVGATPRKDTTLDGFSAQQLLVSSPIPVKIVSEVPGEIHVISYPAAEVALDSISTGYGNLEAAAPLPEANITLEFKDGGALIQALSGERTPERILLHVRVPHGSSIVIDSPRIAADVTIAGEIGDVTVQVLQGNLAVRGAKGNLNLRTGRGSIGVDARADQSHILELRAEAGDITVFALNAKVLASTTNGRIQFVGTLLAATPNVNAQSEFAVKGAGDISVALPDHARFRYRAFGGAHVITDLARDAEPCGLVSSSTYDFRRRASSAGELGRIDVSGTYTGTNQVQGTVGDGIMYFETDRQLVTVLDPRNPPARSGGSSSIGTVGDCGRLTTERLAVANIDFVARAESGSIWIHQIKMRK